MNSYIFITTEGCTFQPQSISMEPDIENCQVLGFAKGKTPHDAFDNLVKENGFLLDTTFDELVCLQLAHEDYFEHRTYFHLIDSKTNLQVL